MSALSFHFKCSLQKRSRAAFAGDLGRSCGTAGVQEQEATCKGQVAGVVGQQVPVHRGLSRVGGHAFELPGGEGALLEQAKVPAILESMKSPCVALTQMQLNIVKLLWNYRYL